MEAETIFKVNKKDLLNLLSEVVKEDRLLTHQEVMKELGIKRTQYAKLKKAGLIPVKGLGTLERVLKSELYARFEQINKYLDVV